MSTERHERVEAPDNRPAIGAVADKQTGMVTFSEVQGETLTAWISIEDEFVEQAADYPEVEQ